MPSPGDPPIQSVQHAANLLARGLARGQTYAQVSAAYPQHFRHLGQAERLQVRQYARDADLIRQALADAPPGTPISDLPEYIQARGGVPVASVTVPFGQPSPRSGRYSRYETANIPITGAATLASIGEEAGEAVQYSSSHCGEDMQEQMEIVLLPFDLEAS